MITPDAFTAKIERAPSQKMRAVPRLSTVMCEQIPTFVWLKRGLPECASRDDRLNPDDAGGGIGLTGMPVLASCSRETIPSECRIYSVECLMAKEDTHAVVLFAPEGKPAGLS